MNDVHAQFIDTLQAATERATGRAPRRALYFYRLCDDDYVAEFCVANFDDAPTPEFPAGQYVDTLAPDGSKQRWAKRVEGDLLVFRPPDGYSGGQGLGWAYDRRLQTGAPMPRAEMEKLATRCRVSAVTSALRG